MFDNASHSYTSLLSSPIQDPSYRGNWRRTLLLLTALPLRPLGIDTWGIRRRTVRLARRRIVNTKGVEVAVQLAARAGVFGFGADLQRVARPPAVPTRRHVGPGFPMARHLVQPVVRPLVPFIHVLGPVPFPPPHMQEDQDAEGRDDHHAAVRGAHTQRQRLHLGRTAVGRMAERLTRQCQQRSTWCFSTIPRAFRTGLGVYGSPRRCRCRRLRARLGYPPLHV